MPVPPDPGPFQSNLCVCYHMGLRQFGVEGLSVTKCLLCAVAVAVAVLWHPAWSLGEGWGQASRDVACAYMGTFSWMVVPGLHGKHRPSLSASLSS